MKKLFNIAKNSKALSVDRIFFEVVNDQDVIRYIIYLNRTNQLFENSVGVDGEEIGYYEWITVNGVDGVNAKGDILFSEDEIALFEGGSADVVGTITKDVSVGDPYIFKDTGDFFKSFNVNVDDGGFIITAETDKGDTDLIKEYGQLLGLTDENKSQFAKAIKPLVIAKVREILLTEVL